MKKLIVAAATGAMGASLIAGGTWAAGSGGHQSSTAGRVSAEKSLTAATGTTGTVQTSGAQAAKAAPPYKYKWVEQTFSFSPLHTFHSFTVRARVKYNTKKVYVVDGPFCRKNRQISPVTATQTWCGNWNNGGGDRGYTMTGINFTVFTGVQILTFPAGFETQEYGRIKITRHGHVTYQGGGF